MANKSNSRAPSVRHTGKTPSKAPAKSKGSLAGDTGAKVVRLGRNAASALRDETTAIKKSARGTLRDVSRRVRDLGDEAEQLGSGAAQSATQLASSIGDFASEHRYAIALGAISLGLVATARQLAARPSWSAPSAARPGAQRPSSGSTSIDLTAVAESAQAGAQAALHQVEQGYERAEQAVQSTFGAHPLLIGGAVVAAGLAIGFALPASDREHELLADVGKGLARQGKHALEDVVTRSEHAVQAATNVAKFASAAFSAR